MCADKYHIERTAPAAGKTLLGAAGSSAARTLCGMWFSVKNGDYIYDGKNIPFSSSHALRMCICPQGIGFYRSGT